MMSSGEFDDDDSYGGGGDGAGGGGSGYGGGGGGSGRGGTREYIVSKSRGGGGDEFGGDESGAGSSGAAASGASGGTANPGRGGSGGGASGPGDESSSSGGARGSEPVAGTGGSVAGDDGGASAGATSSGSAGGGAKGGTFSSGSNVAPPTGAAPDKSVTPDGYQGQQGGSVMAGSSASAESNGPAGAADTRSEKERVMAGENRGKDWALKQKPPRSIPVRRTIRVTVGKDQLAIAPDSGPATAGKVVAMRGDTVESIDEFVKQVRDHIDAWGIAGNNLYWRPVVVLSVGPDAQQRASDLSRLLKNSGLEIRADETAKNVPQGSAHETR